MRASDSARMQPRDLRGAGREGGEKEGVRQPEQQETHIDSKQQALQASGDVIKIFEALGRLSPYI